MDTMEMTSSTASDQSTIAIIITATVCIVAMTIIISLVLSIIFCCVYCRRGNQQRRSDVEETLQSDSRISSFQGPDCEAIIPQAETIDSLVQASLKFGNCSSLSLLIQRHIVRCTNLERKIEKGQFFHKYSGLWRQEKVLVKIYPTKYETLWFAETEMYQIPCMRHENILCFVAADILQKNSQLNHYLVTKYYERGTLFDYLQHSTLDMHSTLFLAETLASGLAHLHCEGWSEHGTVLKPIIAHRNLTSRSVYVTDQGSCCIADLSLAVKNGSNISTELRNKPLGDARYSAPEILEGAGSQQNIENDEGSTTIEFLKKADMYSYALVLWEIARRCSIQGVVEDAELPYMDVTREENASSAELKQAVCEREQRPPLSDRWNTDENMQVVVQCMTECWHSDTAIRNTSARVSKTFQNLTSQVKPGTDKNGKLLRAYNLN